MFLTMINRKNLEFFLHFLLKFIFKNFDLKNSSFFSNGGGGGSQF